MQDRCSFCGVELREGSNFCGQCGREQVVECACGRINKYQAVFCSNCGRRLGAVLPSEFLDLCSRNPYAGCRVGEIICLGRYPQGRNAEVEPIEWQVLAQEDNRLLLLARHGLEVKPFNAKWGNVTWAKCDLRRWLNGEFLNQAFSEAERKYLPEVKLHNPSGEYLNVEGGADTVDRVFLLSYQEARNFLKNRSERCCKPTYYALLRYAYTCKSGDYVNNCWWWLRSPGDSLTKASRVLSVGGFGCNSVTIENGCVRPAVYLSIS